MDVIHSLGSTNYKEDFLWTDPRQPDRNVPVGGSRTSFFICNQGSKPLDYSSDGLILLRRFQRDLVLDRFDVDRISDTDFDNAGSLIERYGFVYRLRSLDALQLASALKLEREGKLDYFVAADKVLCEVAALEGLAVINPDVS